LRPSPMHSPPWKACEARCLKQLSHQQRTIHANTGCSSSCCCWSSLVACDKPFTLQCDTSLEYEMPFFSSIENLLYDVSRLFLAPVLLLIAAALAYALLMLGGFAVEAWQRRRGTHTRELFVHAQSQGSDVAGDDLELWILQRLEWLRIVSRTAPMLGLIATMIPMGPALLALGGGN